MNIGELISVRANFDKTMKQKLLEMTTYFQGHLWDGCSDEDDPKFISKADFDALEALVGKIQHMVFDIGCPVSVAPMIESIISRKLKHWQGSDSVETDDRKGHTPYKDENGQTRLKTIITKGHKKGKQLKTRSEKIIVKKSAGYYGDKGIILTGHFRWNNRGYILSRRATEVLECFYWNNFPE